MKTRGTAGPDARMVPPSASSFAGQPSKAGLPNSLGDAVPRPRQYRHVNLPDVLSEAEVDRILAAVDQSTALGRRDYAILLLAARYGLRPCDIRQLTLDDIDWRGGAH